MTGTLSPTLDAALSAPARDRVERYLDRVRRTLGEGDADREEIERDIVEHIEAALAESPPPIAPTAVEAVLERLGSPRQWAPRGARPTPRWRDLLGFLSAGRDDWRLAGLSFAVFLAATAAIPVIGPFGLLPSYLLARAVVALAAGRNEELGAKRWLIYPPLVAVAASVLVTTLVWVVFPLAELAEKLPAGTLPAARVLVVLAGLGVWWLALAQLAVRALPAVRFLLFPLAGRLERRHGRIFSWIALAAAVTTGLTCLLIT